MVEIVQVRGIDIKPGDIVHARPDEMLGWFLVHKVASLPNDMITVTDEDEINGFLIAPLDIVGLQIMAPLVGGSHAPEAGSGPTSASQQFGEAQDAAAAVAKEEAAAQALEDAAAPAGEVEAAGEKSGLFS